MKLFIHKKYSLFSILFIWILLTFSPILSSISLQAQELKALPNDIFEALSAKGKDDGIVVVRQPVVVRTFVGKTSKRAIEGLDSSESIVLSNGFRIEAYNGNLPTSKQEAYRRAELINEALHSTACYITYKAPFWRLLIGDYSTIEEARVALDDLRRAVPSFARELYIVRDKIRK